MDSMQTDVVVIGGGLAGHRCALEAAQAGAQVLLLEKMPAVGGSTAMSGGSIAFAGTDLQRAAGVEDGADKLREDLLNASGGFANPALIDIVVARQLEEFGFLTSRGIPFGPVQPSSGQSVPRVHSTPSARLIERLHAELRSLPNVQVLLEARAMRLARSGRRIDTVGVEQKGRAFTIAARRGIVLATGGFSRSVELLRRFAPELASAQLAGGEGNEGDGLRMAWEFGADFLEVGFVKGTFGVYYKPVEGAFYTVLLPIYKGAIALNTAGERFVDESQSYKTLGAACLEQDRVLAFQVFDAAIMAQSADNTPSMNFRKSAEEGRVISAPTLAELAAKLGLPADKVAASVARYNADVAAGGVDRQFGRQSLVHVQGTPVPIAQGPFYAYPTTTAVNSTYAGLRVDTDMTVLNVWGERLEGLHAAGEVTGGFHGEAYMTGSSLLKALVCGAVAGRAVLETH